MPIDSESLYLMLGQLISVMPSFFGFGPLTTEQVTWLGRATALVEASGDIGDTAMIKVCAANMTGVAPGGALRLDNAQAIAVILHRTLARAELQAPVVAQGAFIPAGNAFDALAALSKVLRLAVTDLLIVDPYMDEKTLIDYTGLANVGVTIRLLADAAYVKPTLKPAATAWMAQHGSDRPLEARLAPAKTLHDRLVIIDGKTVYTLTQSLNAFATRAPASVVRVDPETSAIKVNAYVTIWGDASPL
jgi:hypothetical protein